MNCNNVFSYLSTHMTEKILVIADGAAFGPEMERVMRLMTNRDNIMLYLPESFEWLILKSGIINDSEVKNILEEPYSYIDSEDYFSWERFFTSLLVNKTEGSYLKYNKKRLNPAYLQSSESDKLLSSMEKIDIKWKKRG